MSEQKAIYTVQVLNITGTKTILMTINQSLKLVYEDKLH